MKAVDTGVNGRLINVADLTLITIERLGDSVIEEAIRKILQAECDEAAAFQSTI